MISGASIVAARVTKRVMKYRNHGRLINVNCWLSWVADQLRISLEGDLVCEMGDFD